MKRFSLMAAMACAAILFSAFDASACGRVRAKLFGGCHQPAPAASCGATATATVTAAPCATATAHAVSAPPATCTGNSCSQSAPAETRGRGGLFGFGLFGR